MVRIAATVLVVGWTAALTLATGGSARAQDVSVRERESAAEAYDRGTSAYLARDYARAAQWFETAHRLAPAAAALVQAVRSHERAGNALRAATLALRLRALYEDRAARQAADHALARADRFVRVEVRCSTECAIQADGVLVDHPEFFVEPGSEHVIEAGFDTGTQRETIRGDPGDERSLTFEPPPAPEPPAVAETGPEPGAGPEPSGREVVAEPAGGGIGVVPWPITIAAIGATAVLGGVLIWSGVDTLDGVPAYEMNPTAEALAEGQSREERTDWLIVGTSAMAGVSLLLAIFTEWGSDRAPRTDTLEAHFFFLRERGVAASVAGRF